MIRVAFCCHGNICRSTLSESVFTHKVNTLGLGDQFIIDSFATSREEIGNPPHRGTVNKLREVGIPLVPHRAKQITLADYDKFDYIIGMEQRNIASMLRFFGADPNCKLKRLLDFSSCPRDIADPWYTGNFEKTYQDILEGCTAFLQYIRAKEKF